MLIRQFRRSITGAVALTVLLSAPAIAATPVDVGEGTDRPQGSNATVMVNNCNTLDVEIFAETEGGQRSRIGTVRRTTQHELKLPDWLADGTTTSGRSRSRRRDASPKPSRRTRYPLRQANASLWSLCPSSRSPTSFTDRYDHSGRYLKDRTKEEGRGGMLPRPVRLGYAGTMRS